MPLTRERVLSAVERQAIHDFPKAGGRHASTAGVAWALGISLPEAHNYLDFLRSEGRVVKLEREDMWRVAQ